MGGSAGLNESEKLRARTHTSILIRLLEGHFAACGVSCRLEDVVQPALQLLQARRCQAANDVGDSGIVRDNIDRLVFLQVDDAVDTIGRHNLLAIHGHVVVHLHGGIEGIDAFPRLEKDNIRNLQAVIDSSARLSIGDLQHQRRGRLFRGIRRCRGRLASDLAPGLRVAYAPHLTSATASIGLRPPTGYRAPLFSIEGSYLTEGTEGKCLPMDGA